MQVVSSLLAGAAAGSLAGSALADSLGRKTALLLDAVPLLVGALISATASSLTSMVAGRVLCGLGIGLASALVPLYISEVGSPSAEGCTGLAPAPLLHQPGMDWPAAAEVLSSQGRAAL